MPVAPSGAASVATPDAFWTQVLVDMGAPVTQSNIEALRAWSEREGGGGIWNPLNSTQKMTGSSFFNHLSGNTGVQNYVSAQQGAQATAATIDNGNYPSIVAAFKGGNALPALVSGGKGAIGQQLRKWSGGGYNNIMASADNYIAPALRGKTSSTGAGGSNTPLPANASATPAATTSGCKTIGESMSGAALGVPGAQQVAGFVGWITQACVYKRLAIQGVSLLLILYGLKMMGHDEPLKIIQSPIDTAKAAAMA